MLKKTITYRDYNDVERTEDFYFNLTRAELLEMEASKVGGFSNIIQTIINTKDVSSIIPIFKEIVLKAYGEKSLDGKRFVKNKEITEGFSQTEAYSQLFMELAGDDKAATAFINGIMPKIDTKKE
jgi:hypothetical protein